MKLSNYFHILKKTSLFKNFTQEDFASLFENLNYKISKYSKDSMVFMEKEPCNTLNIILDGGLRVQKIDSFGRLLVIAEFNTGELVGETLIFGEPNFYPMTGISTIETTMLYIPKDAVLYLCQRDHVFLVEFLKLISGKTITLSSKIDQISLKTIRQRICEFLIMEFKKNNSTKIELKMTKKDWAEQMGVQRPSLSRELFRMKEEGLIDYNYKYIFIKDLDSIGT